MWADARSSLRPPLKARLFINLDTLPVANSGDGGSGNYVASGYSVYEEENEHLQEGLRAKVSALKSVSSNCSRIVATLMFPVQHYFGEKAGNPSLPVKPGPFQKGHVLSYVIRLNTHCAVSNLSFSCPSTSERKSNIKTKCWVKWWVFTFSLLGNHCDINML